MVVVPFDSAFPQAGAKEGLQKDGESSPQKRPMETRSRNPFLFPPGVHLLSKGKGEPAPREKLTEPAIQLQESQPAPLYVRAILISDQIRLATIGPHIVAVGDKLHDETILEINKDRVIVGKGDKKRTLFLQQSPFQLTIEERQ